MLEGRRRARRTILAPPCASRPAAPPYRRVRAAVAQTPPSERAPPHRAHTARGVGPDASIDVAWRPSTASVARLIYQPPPRATLGPCTAVEPRYGPCRARRRTGLCNVHKLAAAPSKRAPRKSRTLARGGARGGAGRGDVSYSHPAPFVCAPPQRARLDARAHLRVDLSANPQIRYAQGAVGVRAPVARLRGPPPTPHARSVGTAQRGKEQLGRCRPTLAGRLAGFTHGNGA